MVELGCPSVTSNVEARENETYMIYDMYPGDQRSSGGDAREDARVDEKHFVAYHADSVPYAFAIRSRILPGD